MELDTVVSGSAGKRRRNGDNGGNDRSCKRSAVMRVCTTGEGEEMGVTWELVGLAMRQVAVKWSTTGEWRVFEWVRERRAIWGAVGR
jgi:hypothetical protein